MEVFKKVDLAISTMLIMTFFVWYWYDQSVLFTAYFITGGWQVLSMLMHEVKGWFTTRFHVRRCYHLISLIILLLGMLAPFIPFLFFIYYIMLFAAPAMAIFYAVMCYTEVLSLSDRPLRILK